MLADFRDQEFRAEIVEDRTCRLTVRVSGDIDISTVGLARAAMRDVRVHESIHVVLDLSGVQFMDCSGVHLLLEQHSQALHRGVLLDVIASPAVDRILLLVGARDSLRASISSLWG